VVRAAYLLPALAALSGCVTERIIERPVPIQPPSLCLTDCPVPDGAPETNGALLESWQAHREAVACFRSRQQCVREMVSAPPAR
jgi:hypothetical protein